MRPYVAKTRSLVSLAFAVVPASKDQIALLADTFMREALSDGSVAVSVVKEFAAEELADILREELKLFPHSPVSMEVKRIMRKHFKRMARQVAKEILVGD